MDRRQFVRLSGLVSAYTLTTGCYATPSSWTGDPMDRIGMSTVQFRERYAQTREEASGHSELTLLQTPEFFADRYKLSNVEFWSLHFDSTKPTYLQELKQKVEAAKATLINIQCDEEYQISDPDEKERKRSMELVLHWMDVAVAVGSKAIRVNPGEGELDLAIQSFRTLNQAAKEKGLILMVENHFGLATDPENHVRMIKEAGPDNFFTLPDYGNYPEEYDRYEALQQIMPYAYQVSAKVTEFNAQGEHIGFDFDRCMEIAEQAGFKGIYSVEQWSPGSAGMDQEKIGDWLIDRVKRHVAKK